MSYSQHIIETEEKIKRCIAKGDSPKRFLMIPLESTEKARKRRQVKIENLQRLVELYKRRNYFESMHRIMLESYGVETMDGLEHSSMEDVD